MLVHCSTQHPTEMQHAVAHALGLHAHHVQVVCRRMGGGFGGKESQSAQFACIAAVAAAKLQRPVKLRLDRDDDFLITGRRHGFSYDWDVGFDDDGRILGVELTMISQRRTLGRSVGPGDDTRGVPLRQRLLAAACRDPRLPGEDQHAEQHRIPRLRRAAGRDRDRVHPRLGGAGARQGSAAGAARELLWHRRQERHAVPAARRRQHHPRADRRAGRVQRLRAPPRPGVALQCIEPGAEERPRADAGEVRHLVQRQPLQPGRRAGACLQRRLDPREPRRHRDGPGPEHEGRDGRRARIGRAAGVRARHRHRHREGGQHLGHRCFDRQ